MNTTATPQSPCVPVQTRHKGVTTPVFSIASLPGEDVYISVGPLKNTHSPLWSSSLQGRVCRNSPRAGLSVCTRWAHKDSLRRALRAWMGQACKRLLLHFPLFLACQPARPRG